MRWVRPDNKDMREITKFLWFPVRVGRETRWLERVTLIQKYEAEYFYANHCWRTIEFKDK